MSGIDSIFYVVVLIMSVVIHEFAHGYAAYRFGDDTARLSGRLTLNPIRHLDLFGSIILPLMLVIFNSGFMIGWAKPVPVNTNNLKKGRWPSVIVSFAGIFANLILAIIFGLLIRVVPLLGFPAYDFSNPHPFYIISQTIVLLNLVLALFNIIPIPPLDGSKILFEFLPYRFRYIEEFLERWGIFFLLLFIFSLWKYVSPIIYFIFTLITGIN